MARRPIASRPTRPPSTPWRSWLVAAVAAFVAYACASRGLFLLAAAWQIPLLVGAVTSLLAERPRDAALIAPVAMAAGMIALPPTLPDSTPTALAWALGIALSAGAGYGVAWLRLGSPQAPATRQRTARVTLTASIALVAWVVAALWLGLVTSPSGAFQGYSAIPASFLREVPQPGTYVFDDSLYLRLYYLLHRGTPFYQAFRDAWAGLQGHVPLPGSPAGFRLPTFYWLWRLLPSDPFSIVYLYLGFATLGVVSAGYLAGRLAGARFAPLGALALAAYAMGVGSTVILISVDLPAACVALAGIALFAHARAQGGSRAWLWAAAAFVLAAALMREILVYVLVLAALSALLEPRGRRRSTALPWLVGVGVFAMAYAAHSAVVWPYLARGSLVSYAHGGLAFAWDGITHFATKLNGQGAMQSALIALGIAGALASYRRAGWAFAAFVTATIVVPFAAMLFVGNPGIQASGNTLNYWGALVVPLALALWPVSAAWFLPTRKR